MKNNNEQKTFKFIDLCAGIGGFHLALKEYGGECVLAAEIDKFAIEVYKENYNINSENNITKIAKRDIPAYDVLCAGFPCQTFSKAGSQLGFEDIRGTIFFDIIRILIETQPKYVLLENVRNLASHDKGNTWNVIRKKLIEIGYLVPEKPFILSPINFGVPQSRERVFIPCIRKDATKLKKINLIVPPKQKTSVFDILEKEVGEKYKISLYEREVLEIWEEFIMGIESQNLGFPIWYDSFRLKKKEIVDLPKWKQDIINKNIKLYSDNKKFINKWEKQHKKLQNLKPTDRKFEWQMGNNYKSIYEGIIQFRPSGVRVKKPDFFPALVAIVHIPIVGKYLRKLTPKECSRLQSFPEEFKIISQDNQAYKQFGNSLNVKVAKYVFENTILKEINKNQESSK